MPVISGSILAANHVDLKNDVQKLENNGVDVIHVDIMDGHYVKNLTFGPKMVKDLRSITKLPIDIHFEMYRQEEFVDSFIDAGADMITLQYESCTHPLRTIEQVKLRGCKVSLAIAPMTDVKELFPYLHELDEINLMTVEPGFGGQKFREEVLTKIKQVHDYISSRSLSTKIAIDGGVNSQNIVSIIDSGVQNVVIGNFLFKDGEVAENLKVIKALINSTILEEEII